MECNRFHNIITNAKEASVASGVWLAYVHLAVFDAVNAIDHRFQPYLFTTNPPPGANRDAAAIAAAHRVLVNYFPTQGQTLDGQYATSIAAISDSAANITAGVAVGEASAQAVITARANDGLLANVPYTPPTGLGFWQPTPPSFGPPLTPWLGQMVPFTMTSAAQFFPDEGPDAELGIAKECHHKHLVTSFHKSSGIGIKFPIPVENVHLRGR